MMLPGLKNPFLAHQADDTVTLPPGDVPELHAHVLAKCNEAVTQVRYSGHSAGLLVIGEAGSGKSHLIAQLRKQLAGDRAAVLAAIRLKNAYTGRLWRRLRESLVEELLRQYPNPAHGANGLLRILQNRFPRWAATAQGAAGGLLDWLVGRSKSADLKPHLEDFARTHSLDYHLVQVLPLVANPDLTRPAHSWLQGTQLGARDLERLGLPPVFPSEQEQEVQAQEVVLSFLRLAGDATLLTLCFDQVEWIQAGNWDEVALKQFATMATGLVAETGPRVVLTCVRPNLLDSMRKAVDVSDLQKFGRDQTTIPTLTRNQAARVTKARLESDPECQTLRLQHASEELWPLGKKFLDDIFQQNRRNLTPRHLIMACRLEFDRIQKGKEPEAPSQPTGPDTLLIPVVYPDEAPDLPALEPVSMREQTSPTPVPLDEFARMWDRQREKHLQKLQGIQFDTVMAISLPWLVGLTGNPYAQVQEEDHRLGDVNLLFQPRARGPRPVGVSFCNHQPQMLWRRLDRLQKQWKAVKDTALGSLVVLRSDFERRTETANNRLELLRQNGVRVVLVDRQQLAELTAFQVMLTAALAGDLTRNGRPVEVRDYDAWAKEHLSEAVKEFFYLVFEPGSRPTVAAPPVPNRRTKAGSGKK
jgi:AAA ATPase domain